MGAPAPVAAGQVLLENFKEYIVDPAMYLLFALGLFLFVWGLVQFLWSLNENANRQEGVQHMIWGIVGMFIMVAVWGIIFLLSNTFQLGVNPDGSVDPPDVRWTENIKISF